MNAGSAHGFVDLHSHVLPGVDDGARDVAQALELLRAAGAEGTAEIVATPHQHPFRYPNDAETLRRAHAVLTEAREAAVASGERLPAVRLGAEVHLDAGLEEAVRRGAKLRLAETSVLLLELPDAFPLAGALDLAFRLRLDGTTPLIAHPERNPQLLRRQDQVARLVELGCLVQVTGMSLSGGFGAPCRAATEALVARGLVHVVASDAHHPTRRPAGLAGAHAALAATFGEEVARRLLVLNPRAILEGRAGEVVAPSKGASRGGLLARLRRKASRGRGDGRW